MIGLSLSLPNIAGLNKGVRYEPETYSLRSRLPVSVSSERLRAASDFVAEVKAADAWSALDLVYLPIGESGDEDNNLVNWVSDAFMSTVNDAPYSGYGWTGDGLSQYFETGAAHNGLANYSQNLAFMGVVVLSDAANSSLFDAGFAAPTTYINPRSNSTQMAVRANSTSGTLAQWTLPGTATSVGFSWFTRRSSTDLYLGRNAEVSTVFSQTSAALGSSTVTMMKAGTTYSTRKNSGLIVGGNITPAQGQAIGQAVVNYYATLGITL